jgi:phage portal protein BeeE
MANFRNEQLQLVFGENPSSAEDQQTHLFARREQRFVDLYTAGTVQNFERASPKYLPFRIKRVFAVEPA